MSADGLTTMLERERARAAAGETSDRLEDVLARARAVRAGSMPPRDQSRMAGAIAIDKMNARGRVAARLHEHFAPREAQLEEAREDQLEEAPALPSVPIAPAPIGIAKITLDDSQRRAADLIRTARIGVVTGGPGTGKTTTLRVALDEVEAAGVSVLLAAPTGKAARRMHVATGRPASTVHRLLDYGPTGIGAEMGFRRDASCPIAAGLVVVDEASMLDVELADALFAALDPAVTRLVLVGDADQLPSVGPGRVFADMIASGEVPVARLERVHRSMAESWVCSQAPRILRGELPDLAPRKDFAIARADGRVEAARAVVQAVTRFLPERVGESATGDNAQVLVPMRTGDCGTEAINGALQERLNPGARKGPTFRVGPYVIGLGDRVIQTRNNYALGVMNGECGRVLRVLAQAAKCVFCAGSGLVYESAPLSDNTPRVRCPDCGGRGEHAAGVHVQIDGRADVIVYSTSQAEGLALAYALTVHKSQGSEWPWVVCVMHSTHSIMLTRQLLYTAITRAKVGVVLIGDDAGIARAVRETRDAKRNTGLVERLRDASADASGAEADVGAEGASVGEYEDDEWEVER